jgi:lysozyme
MLQQNPSTPRLPLVDYGTLLENRIRTHEGESPFAYQDSMGYWTIGIGKCVDKRAGSGLTVDEMLYLLRAEISACKQQLQSYHWYIILDEVRRGVLVELCFNIGLPKLLKFTKMLLALGVLDYYMAAKELLNSAWASQVGPTRSADMEKRLRDGCY